MNDRTTPAIIRLWWNLAFLPVAVTIELWRDVLPARPADNADSGAPEGAEVYRLADYREANNGR